MVCLITGTVFLVWVEHEEVMVRQIRKEDAPGLFSPPYDPRFPNTNQSKSCYQNYLDFHRCTNKRGEGFDACQYFKKVYLRICPNSWIEKWDEQVTEGVFAGKV